MADKKDTGSDFRGEEINNPPRQDRGELVTELSKITINPLDNLTPEEMAEIACILIEAGKRAEREEHG